MSLEPRSLQKAARQLSCALFLLVPLTTLTPTAHAVDLQNGDFEAVGAGWIVEAKGAIGLAGPDLEATCDASLGTLGLRIGRNFAGTNGSQLSKVFQQFNCRPDDEDEPEQFCTVAFSAKYSLAAGEQARVALSTAGGTVARAIPVSAMFEDYSLSIEGCVAETTIYFDVIRPGPQPGIFGPLTSRLCVDDVSCSCTDTDDSSEDLPGPENPPENPTSVPTLGDPGVYTLPLDCNENNVSDDLDISERISSDVNGNGFPDECEAVVAVPTLSEWGAVGMTLLLLAIGVLYLIRRPQKTATPHEPNVT